MTAPRTSNKSAWWIGILAGLTGALVVLLFTGLVAPGFFRSEEPQDRGELPASEVGGQKFDDRTLLQTMPHQTVRMVYHRIADGEVTIACGQFTDEAARQFAANFSAPSCADAVTKLRNQVTGTKNDYAEPVFPADVLNVSSTATVVEVSSCEMRVTGGPRLGWFKVEKTPHKGQWIITGHRPETCS